MYIKYILGSNLLSANYMVRHPELTNLRKTFKKKNEDELNIRDRNICNTILRHNSASSDMFPKVLHL